FRKLPSARAGARTRAARATPMSGARRVLEDDVVGQLVRRRRVRRLQVDGEVDVELREAGGGLAREREHGPGREVLRVLLAGRGAARRPGLPVERVVRPAADRAPADRAAAAEAIRGLAERDRRRRSGGRDRARAVDVLAELAEREARVELSLEAAVEAQLGLRAFDEAAGQPDEYHRQDHHHDQQLDERVAAVRPHEPAEPLHRALAWTSASAFL